MSDVVASTNKQEPDWEKVLEKLSDLINEEGLDNWFDTNDFSLAHQIVYSYLRKDYSDLKDKSHRFSMFSRSTLLAMVQDLIESKESKTKQ